MQTLPWIVALVALVALAIGLLTWLLTSRKPTRPKALPTEWGLAPRPVFSTIERRLHRLLREAFPQHIVLAKLPLVRFCQPTQPGEMRYWYDLLGSGHVTFAVCSANGRVLLALDLDSDHGSSRRSLQIKQAVLNVCRVRYVRCPVEQLPTLAELQLMVPVTAAPVSAPRPTAATSAPPAAAPPPELTQARDTLSTTVASRRAERTALWQDSTVFQDSFFAPDSRLDFAPSEFAPSPKSAPVMRSEADAEQALEEGGGVVVDSPRFPPLPPV